MIRADTIAAIATPRGIGGIGIVRISGPDSLAIAQNIFQPHSVNDSSAGGFSPRMSILGRLVDSRTGGVLDECLLTYFKAPHSYTGEDVVEFSCHGSQPVLDRLIELLAESGTRLAERGEFTYRAVVNGRMDLTKAEATNRLIRARTLMQAEQAVRQLEGRVSLQVSGIEDRLLDIIARMEAAVDFAEEDEDFIERDVALNSLSTLCGELKGLTSGFAAGNKIREGAVVVIAGRANVGKSTLFNAILKQERSIVDHQPGTTRDYIAETIELDGLPITIVDTAGLRKGGESVEIEGMRRTEKQIGRADLVLMVTEAGNELYPEERDIFESLAIEKTAVIHVANKTDKLQRKTGLTKGRNLIHVSALTQDGVTELIEQMRQSLGIDELKSEKGIITELRQQQLFSLVAEKTSAALALYEENAYDEVVLEELNGARKHLGEITGGGATEEILERIFSRFCVGK